jgi:hypothetical protein
MPTTQKQILEFLQKGQSILRQTNYFRSQFSILGILFLKYLSDKADTNPDSTGTKYAFGLAVPICLFRLIMAEIEQNKNFKI